MSIHYHHCPECYEKYPCDLDCTIEPDLSDPICHPDKEFGAHCVCSLCEDNQYDTLWWLKYNGFSK